MWRKDPIPAGLWAREGPAFEPVCKESDACLRGYTGYPDQPMVRWVGANCAMQALSCFLAWCFMKVLTFWHGFTHAVCVCVCVWYSRVRASAPDTQTVVRTQNLDFYLQEHAVS